MNYYNDNDPYCCAWLRNLVAAGHLPKGDVDERSILEVQPADLDGYEQAHFFAGIGGWPLALSLAGWAGPCWTGSCPCQPLSSAGKRQGHADQRHLWPAFHRLIAECRPATIFGEQVASKDAREWLSAVRSDLEALGYACGASDLCAAGAGALHARHRLYWVAAAPDTDGMRREGERAPPAGTWGEQQFTRLVQDQLKLSVPSGRLRSLVDGVFARTPKLRAYGNAIVPQVAAEFIKAVMECRP